jgi:hypothetical protein
MIDQSQLEELMEAKKMLEAQKIAKASAQLSNKKDYCDFIGSAFNSNIFAPSQNSQMD